MQIKANQWTSFYIIGTSVTKELIVDGMRKFLKKITFVLRNGRFATVLVVHEYIFVINLKKMASDLVFK